MPRTTTGFSTVLLVWLVTAGCAPSESVESGLTIPPEMGPTSTTVAPSVTTLAETTTTTLPPLQSLAYEEVARVEFPIAMVVTQSGQTLLATKDGQVMTFPELVGVLDISESVRNSGEQGLLGMAVHPTDAALIYLHYSANNGDTVLSEFPVNPSNVIDPGSERVLLTVDQPAANHNGGMIQFGPDGYLYLGLGDGGGANDQFGNGQNLNSLLGGIVRIDVRPTADAPYTVPSDNPFVGVDGADELWAYGLRNPWRFWIENDLIYIADVGQNTYEEVSVAPLTPGQNFGWPVAEGLHCFRPSSGCDTTGTVTPVVEVRHGDRGTCSITGGLVYRGAGIPELDGYYLYSDYCGGYLRGFRFEEGEAVDQRDWTEEVGSVSAAVSFGIDSAGEVYLLTFDRVFKLVAVR